MRGRVFLGFLIFSYSFVQSQTFKCYLSDSTYKHGIKLHYTKKSVKFSKPLNYAAVKFPELEGINIEIRRKKIGTMMAARPRLDFLFRNKNSRRYVIYITNHPEMNAGPIFNEMSECAQAGVLGHELSHILSYKEKTNLEMLWFAITYMFNRKRIETETDQMAMERGFGDQLLEYTKYIHESPHTNQKYLSKKKKHYLSVNEMRERILELL